MQSSGVKLIGAFAPAAFAPACLLTVSYLREEFIRREVPEEGLQWGASGGTGIAAKCLRVQSAEAGHNLLIAKVGFKKGYKCKTKMETNDGTTIQNR